MENFIFEDKTFQADHFLPLSPAWPGLSVKTALLAGSRAARAPTQQPAWQPTQRRQSDQPDGGLGRSPVPGGTSTSASTSSPATTSPVTPGGDWWGW